LQFRIVKTMKTLRHCLSCWRTFWCP